MRNELRALFGAEDNVEYRCDVGMWRLVSPLKGLGNKGTWR